MIKKYKLESNDNTYLRIWQKINFGKEIIKPEFFKETEIEKSNDGFRLSVYQLNPNTRLFYLKDILFFITSDEAIYNYLDTGRVITYYDGHYHNSNTIYIYNNLIITDKEIIDFEDYKDKDNLNLKLLTEIDNQKVYLVFDEDLKKISSRIAEIRAEEESQDKAEKEEKIKVEAEERQEIEKLESLIRQYDKMALLEDNKTIIQGNFFIDKEAGVKVEFKDKVVKLFDKEDLVRDSLNYQNCFIIIGYNEFLYKLSRFYDTGKWEKPLEEKLEKINNKWLNFKIYSYDKETKTEVFLKEIKIENNKNENGQLRFKVNGIKMPRQKIRKVIDFINNRNKETIIERLTNFENYLEKIRLYSGTQLELLNGKDIEIRLSGVKIPIHFSITAEDKDHWIIGLDDYSLKRNYKDVRSAFHYIRGGGLTAISSICDDLKAGERLEEILIGRVKSYVEKRRLAEDKAEKLFNEFLEKNKTRVFKKDSGYIVKGKLKNYIVKMKNEEDVGVYTYPEASYICINEKTQAGTYLCKFDKLLQFCLCMLNDGNLREEIHTIR